LGQIAEELLNSTCLTCLAGKPHPPCKRCMGDPIEHTTGADFHQCMRVLVAMGLKVRAPPPLGWGGWGGATPPTDTPGPAYIYKPGFSKCGTRRRLVQRCDELTDVYTGDSKAHAAVVAALEAAWAVAEEEPGGGGLEGLLDLQPGEDYDAMLEEPGYRHPQVRSSPHRTVGLLA
jgi:hypothetical protein